MVELSEPATSARCPTMWLLTLLFSWGFEGRRAIRARWRMTAESFAIFLGHPWRGKMNQLRRPLSGVCNCSVLTLIALGLQKGVSSGAHKCAVSRPLNRMHVL